MAHLRVSVSVLAVVACSTLAIFAMNYLAFDQSAFSIDKCDSSSTCTNTQSGIGNTQTNDCTNFSTCANEANGDGNSQFNRCDSTPGNTAFPGCSNLAAGDGNAQSNDCNSSPDFGCRNEAHGNNNIQNVRCRNALDSGCENRAGSTFAGGRDENTQNIDCSNVVDFGCFNLAGGDGNTQNLRCDSIAGNEGCKNEVFLVNDNTQNLNCRLITVDFGGCENVVDEAGSNNIQDMKCLSVSIGCSNRIIGDGNELGENEQSLLCVDSVRCDNDSFGANGNVQKSVCVNSGTCQNSGFDTKVISVNSDNCESGDVPGSKTICVNNRIINRPTS